MTVPAGTPGDEVPTEDWAEQLAEARPSAADESVVAGTAGARSLEADEADLAEQEQGVDLDDEDR